jgi:hypothetical protein
MFAEDDLNQEQLEKIVETVSIKFHPEPYQFNRKWIDHQNILIIAHTSTRKICEIKNSFIFGSEQRNRL